MRETHEIAQAQQQKNAKLREAFGISDYFVEGTSFDPDRKAKEDLAKSSRKCLKCNEFEQHVIIFNLITTEIQLELQAEKDADKANRKNYALVRTPSPDKDDDDTPTADKESIVKGKSEKKKKKKRNRDA